MLADRKQTEGRVNAQAMVNKQKVEESFIFTDAQDILLLSGCKDSLSTKSSSLLTSSLLCSSFDIPTKMPRQSFTAIDFETANASRNSICQVGLVRVIRGQVVDQISVLVKPPHNEYNSFNIGIHGISPSMTANALPFDKIWPALEHYIAGQHVVAHNVGFDKSCLINTLEHYSIPVPSFKTHCTYKLFRGKLSTLCLKYNIALKHHDAHSDALACAQLFMMHLNTTRSYPV